MSDILECGEIYSQLILSKDEKTIVCRKTINDIFHVRNRYPCWRRDSEWPIGSVGVPMLFVAQYSDGQGNYTYEFETRNERLVLNRFNYG